MNKHVKCVKQGYRERWRRQRQREMWETEAERGVGDRGREAKIQTEMGKRQTQGDTDRGRKEQRETEGEHDGGDRDGAGGVGRQRQCKQPPENPPGRGPGEPESPGAVGHRDRDPGPTSRAQQACTWGWGAPGRAPTFS